MYRRYAYIRHDTRTVYYNSVLLDLPLDETLREVRAARPDVCGIPIRGEANDSSINMSVYGSFSYYLVKFSTATPMLNTRLSVVVNLCDSATIEVVQYQEPAAQQENEQVQEKAGQVLPGQTTTIFGFETPQEREEQLRLHREAAARYQASREVPANFLESESEAEEQEPMFSEEEEAAAMRRQTREAYMRARARQLEEKEEDDIVDDDTQEAADAEEEWPSQLQEDPEPSQPTASAEPQQPQQQLSEPANESQDIAERMDALRARSAILSSSQDTDLSPAAPSTFATPSPPQLQEEGAGRGLIKRQRAS
ncbi:hypothetical protein MBANPS3_012182 [Mucor bainieri]